MINGCCSPHMAGYPRVQKLGLEPYFPSNILNKVQKGLVDFSAIQG